MRRHLLIAATALALAGCTASQPPSSPPAHTQLSLVAFDSCDRLLTELRAATERTVTSYGLNAPVPESWSVAGRAATSSASYSATNVHEAGADEPDIVKTDGRRIVTVSRGTLRVIDPATRSLTGSLPLGVSGTAQLLLSGDHALVLSGGGRTMAGRLRGGLLPPAGDVDLILVDLSGPPKILSHYRGAGRVVDARQTGNVARVVLSSTPRIRFPMTATGDAALLKQNRTAVGAATIDSWLPSWEITTGAAVTRGRLDCGAVRRPTSFSGASMLSLLTFDLGASALDDGDPIGVVADGEIVYGTPSNLYVANQFGSSGTELFQFALSSGGAPRLIGTGTVPGMLLNQYALSEWDGRLRVATTANDQSAVRILENHGGDLEEVGKVDGLGRGEQIYAVRFIGSRGFVVTFRQTDPLYTLDLSDPAAPRVTGELKITGYSAHLQQVGDNQLVGIGQETDPQGLLISLFDVADPANPRRLDSRVFARSVSAAQWDPHALLWWPTAQLLVVPTKEAALAFRVAGNELREAGTIDGPIQRSIVLGEELWTLREDGLDIAGLSTFDRLATVRF